MLADGDKTKEQLVSELALLRKRVAELKSVEAERKRVEVEVSSLAKFPSENPNPVLRLATDGTILYTNKARQQS